MSGYEHQILHAPVGMDTLSDPGNLREDRAQVIKGFTPARKGELIAHPALMPVGGTKLPGGSGGSDWVGMAVYQTPMTFGQNNPLDALILVDDKRNVWVHQKSENPSATTGYVIGNMGFTNAIFTYGIRPRFVQFQDELIITMPYGVRAQRVALNPTTQLFSLFQLGIDTPTTALAITETGATTGFPTGTLTYRYTFADEKDRESSPSADQTFVHSGSTILGTNTTVTWPSDRQVRTAYLYRRSSVGQVFYRVASLLRVDSLATQAVADIVSEASLDLGVLAPIPGQNDPPAVSSLACVHRDRLILDNRSVLVTPSNTASTNQIQVSNSGSPTQFSSTSDPLDPNDDGLGGTYRVSSEHAEQVTGLIVHGSILLVFRGRSCHAMYGDGLNTFEMRYLHSVGCAGPNTLCRWGDGIGWLGPDGVYYMEGLEPSKISWDVDNLFSGYAPFWLSQDITPPTYSGPRPIT